LKALVFALLLVASTVHGAQVFSIPEGKTVYGPVAVTTLHRYAGLVIEPTSSAFTKGTFNLFHSLDGGKTFPGDTGDPKTERPFCKVVYLSSAIIKPFGGDCSKPVGTTNIKAVAIVEGGPITIAKLPNLRSR
jgi:hypothetical protein